MENTPLRPRSNRMPQQKESRSQNVSQKLILTLGGAIIVGVLIAGGIFILRPFEQNAPNEDGGRIEREGQYFISDGFQEDYDYSLGKFNFSPATDYLEEVLSAQFLPAEQLHISTAQILPSPNTVQYESEVWSVQGKEIKAIAAYRMGEGEAADTLLDTTIIVEENVEGSPSRAVQMERLRAVFLVPEHLDLATARRTIPPEEFEGVIYESVADNADGSLESRSVYVMENPDGTTHLSFAACRILPASPLFSERTCYQFGPAE